MATSNPDSDGWYHDRPAKDVEEWKDWRHRICCTTYDFTKKLVLRKRPIRKAKTKQAQFVLNRWKCDNHTSVDNTSSCKTRKWALKKKVPPKMSPDKQKHDQQIQIFVKTPLSDTHVFKLKHSMSVLQVKKLLGEELGISADEQELYTQAGHLKMCDLLSLSDHGIEDQSNMEMQVVSGLLGGADKPEEPSEDNTKDGECSKFAPSGTRPKSSHSQSSSEKNQDTFQPSEVNTKDESSTTVQSTHGCDTGQGALAKKDDIQNFVRCRKALQEVCFEVASCVDKKFKMWHEEVASRIGPCETPEHCSKTDPEQPSGRPSGPLSKSDRTNSCEACLEWADEIEAIKKSKDITWANLDSSKFHGDYVEVAKAFVFKAPKDKMKNVERFTQFDEGSLMLIMQSFLPFLDDPPRKASDEEIASQCDEVSEIDFGVGSSGKVGHKNQNSSHEGESSGSTSSDESIEEWGNNSSESSSWSDYEDESQRQRETVEVDVPFEHPERELEQESPPVSEETTDSEDKTKDKRELDLTIIKKVFDIRCNLAHLAVDSKLQMANKKLQDYFADICKLVDLLEELGYFTNDKADDLRARLKEIKTKPVTQTMIAQINDPVCDQLQYLIQRVDSLTDSMDSIKQDNKAIKDEVKKVQKGPESFHLNQPLSGRILELRRRLKTKYMREKKKMRFGKSRHSMAGMDALFVDLELLEEKEPDDEGDESTGWSGSSVKGRKLESLQELLALLEDDLRNHILLFGFAGCGKTTLVSRIAYEWTKTVRNDGAPVGQADLPLASLSVLSNITLVFVLKISKLESNQTLPQAIEGQLLSMASNDVEEALTHLGKKCLVLLDGFDENPAGLEDHILSGSHLSECSVIVTTRPHMVDRFCISQEGYTYIRISGFSKENTLKYIDKFFGKEKQHGLADALKQKVKKTPILTLLSSFPILLVMMCHLWQEHQKQNKEVSYEKLSTSFRSMTRLFQDAVKYLNKPFEGKADEKDIDNVLQQLGKPALEHLLVNKLQFKRNDFVVDGSVDVDLFRKSFEIGLTFQEEDEDDTSIIFIHKTFQEYCSAVYMSKLFRDNKEDCINILTSFNDKLDKMEYLLRFCCGLDVNLGEAVISRVLKLKHDIPDFPQKAKNALRLPLILFYEIELSHDARTLDAVNLHAYLEELDKYTMLKIHDAELSVALCHFAAKEMQLNKVTTLDDQFGFESVSDAVKALHSMPSLTNAHIRVDKLKGHFEEVTLPGLKCLKDLTLSCDYDQSHAIDVALLVRFLRHMPSLESVRLRDIRLEGALGTDAFSLSKSLQRFYMQNYECTLISLTSFLRCMSSLQSIILQNVNLTGVLSDETPLLVMSVRHVFLSMRSIPVSVSTLVTFLKYMPLLENITLRNVSLSGALSKENQLLSQSLTEFNILGVGSTCTCSMLSLGDVLTCLPPTTKSTIQDVTLTGNWDENMPSLCSKLKDLNFSYRCTMALTLGKDSVIGELDENIQSLISRVQTLAISCNNCIVSVNALGGFLRPVSSPADMKVEHFRLNDMANQGSLSLYLSKGNFSITYDEHHNSVHITLLGFPRCLPPNSELRLKETKLTKELDEDTPSAFERVKYLNMPGPNDGVSESVLGKTLMCMPSLDKATLDRVTVNESHENTPVLSEALGGSFVSGFDGRSVLSVLSLLKLVKCLPSHSKLKLQRINLINEQHESSSPLNKCLTDFSMTYCDGTLSWNTLLRLLKCMPSLEQLELKVNLIETVYDHTPLLTGSLQKFKWYCEGQVKWSTLIKFLMCMPSLEEVILKRANFIRGTFEYVPSHCKCLKVFKVIDCTEGIKLSDLLEFLKYTPSLKTIYLNSVSLIGKFDENTPVLKMRDLHIELKYCSISLTILKEFLKWVSSIARLELIHCKLKAGAFITMQSLCISSDELNLTAGVKNNAITVVDLVEVLRYMPSVRVVLKYVKLIGDLSDNSPPLSETLKTLSIEDSYGKLSIITLVRLLRLMPSIADVKLHGVKLMGELDDKLPSLSKTLKILSISVSSFSMASLEVFLKQFSSVGQFKLTNCHLIDWEFTLSADQFKLHAVESLKNLYLHKELSIITLARLLRVMTSIAHVQLVGVKLIGEFDDTMPPLSESLKTLRIFNSSVGLSIIVRLLKLMPSITDVKLERMKLIGDLDENSPTLSQTLKTLSILSSDGGLSINTLVRLLGLMPSITDVELEVTLIGDLDGNSPSLSETLKTLSIVNPYGTSLSIITLVKLLRLMPSITNVKLHGVKLIGELEDKMPSLSATLETLGISKSSFSTVNLEVFLKQFSSVGQFKLTDCRLIDSPDQFKLDAVESLKIVRISNFHCTNELSIITLARLLRLMTSIAHVELVGFKLIRDFDDPMPPLSESLKTLSIVNSNKVFSVISLVRLLRLMPSITDVKLNVKLIGHLDESSPPLSDMLKTVSITNYGRMDIIILVRLLRLMPSIADVKLEGMKLIRDLDENSPLLSETLKTLSIVHSYGGLSIITLVRLLRLMPSITDVKLERVKLNGELDENSPPLESLKTLTILSGVTGEGLMSFHKILQKNNVHVKYM